MMMILLALALMPMPAMMMPNSAPTIRAALGVWWAAC
jgi:hypothetical protein